VKILVYDIAIFGLGYVGLPTAVVFALKGFRVIGVDTDVRKVALINSGKCYIREPGLKDLLWKVVSKGFLKATNNGLEAVKSSNTIVIAVPTPAKNGITDLSFLESVLDIIRRGLRRDQLIVVESTIPPGTMEGFVRPLLEESGFRAEEDFFLAHVPERIAPGKAIDELLHVPRVVGGIGPRSTEKAMELYRRINSNLYPTDVRTAEFIKLIENTFRDLNIAYANLLALIAEKIGVDVYEAIRLANTHPRVNIHWPGAGVGGPCLTKDPYMLARSGENVFGIELIILARRINEYMPYHTLNIIKKVLQENNIKPKEAQIAIFGAAYKGNVDDTRGGPAKVIVRELLKLGVKVVVYDPYTNEAFGAIKANSIDEAVYRADAIVVITDHSEFKSLDLGRLGRFMRHKIIIDGRRVIEPHEAIRHGFKYYGIGFGKVIKI